MLLVDGVVVVEWCRCWWCRCWRVLLLGSVVVGVDG